MIHYFGGNAGSVMKLRTRLIISFFINAGFENALISGFGAGAFAPVFLLGIVAFTDKINLKTAVRALIAVCSVTVLCSYTTLRTFMPADGYSVIISADIGGGRAVIKHGRKSVLILSENCYGSSVKTMLHDNYATDLSAVILLGGENCALSYGGFDLDCRNIYAYGGYFNLQPYGKLIINYEKQFIVTELNIPSATDTALLPKQKILKLRFVRVKK